MSKIGKPKKGEKLIEKYPLLKDFWGTQNVVPISNLPASSRHRIQLYCNKCNHEWETSVNALTASTNRKNLLKGDICPQCRNKEKYKNNKTPCGLPSYRILSTLPEVMKWWSTDNTEDPNRITTGSNKLIHWECQNGHSFTKKVKLFSLKCSRCQKEESLLKNRAPELFSELENKQDFDIQNLSYNNAHKASWKCDNCSRTREACVYQRYNNSSKCPHCAYQNGVSKREKELQDFITIG